jgi:hypothetical protein
VRSLHIAQGPAPTYSKRIAAQVNNVSDVMRAAKKPKISKDFAEDIVRVHAEVADVRWAAYRAPIVHKDYTESIVAVHDEIGPVRRAANRSAPTVSKNFSRAIAALAQKPVAAVVKSIAAWCQTTGSVSGESLSKLQQSSAWCQGLL